eukprot:g549.t1
MRMCLSPRGKSSDMKEISLKDLAEGETKGFELVRGLDIDADVDSCKSIFLINGVAYDETIPVVEGDIIRWSIASQGKRVGYEIGFVATEKKKKRFRENSLESDYANDTGTESKDSPKRGRLFSFGKKVTDEIATASIAVGEIGTQIVEGAVEYTAKSVESVAKAGSVIVHGGKLNTRTLKKREYIVPCGHISKGEEPHRGEFVVQSKGKILFFFHAANDEEGKFEDKVDSETKLNAENENKSNGHGQMDVIPIHEGGESSTVRAAELLSFAVRSPLRVARRMLTRRYGDDSETKEKTSNNALLVRSIWVKPSDKRTETHDYENKKPGMEKAFYHKLSKIKSYEVWGDYRPPSIIKPGKIYRVTVPVKAGDYVEWETQLFWSQSVYNKTRRTTKKMFFFFFFGRTIVFKPVHYGLHNLVVKGTRKDENGKPVWTDIVDYDEPPPRDH